MNAISSCLSPPSLPALKQISPNQHLLVFAMRKWNYGPSEMPDVAQTLFKIFGIYHVEEALEAFETVLSAMIENPVRRLVIAALPQPMLSHGELAVLKLISAFQAGDLQTARALAFDIAGPGAKKEVFCAACQLVKSLDARSIVFTLREYRPLALMPVVGRA